MNVLQKITLLITMAVVTWKVCRIENHLSTKEDDYPSISSSCFAKLLANSSDFRY